ncbi:hypothetical protein A9Q84_02395 [Halobacteriovorax marinus]|uniref:Lipoprotein n=1 Tax=Halobacteriovorax marinus TaxID=97084 RepID=A0A1Y5FCT9_9BACT|nr:hypothetical protein A9Q84_02395 [Halobacteriovorax marinus]
MKKLISILIFTSIIFSTNASAADCFQTLSSDYSQDSGAFKVADYELNGEFEVTPESYSVEALDKLFSNIGCVASVREKAAVKISCKEIMPGNPASSVCYLENELGYFFISKDMLDTVNIVFNRWD